MKTVPLYGRLAEGRVALVDDADYDLVMQYHWNACIAPKRQAIYARAFVSSRRVNGVKHTQQILMHVLITGRTGTDHANGDGLDNQRSNLRETTRSLNAANQAKRRTDASSQYKGICWNQRDRRWRAYIQRDGKRHQIGSFVNEIDAARAYDRAAVKLFGEFARLNLS